MNPLPPVIITILIGNNLAAQGMSTLIERPMETFGPVVSVLVTVLILTPLLLLFGEFLPKQMFRVHGDRWMYTLSWPLSVLRWLLVIPVWLIENSVCYLAGGRRRFGNHTQAGSIYVTF